MFSVRYGVSVRFGFGIFKYPFYSRILVLLVFLCGKPKLLLSMGRCSAWGRFVGFGGISESLMDISGNLILVEFDGIPGLMELGGFLWYVDISGIFRLVGFSGFSRFYFGV